jgi:hypothetical protein
LHASGQGDGGALGQRGARDVDVVMREIGPDVGVEREHRCTLPVAASAQLDCSTPRQGSTMAPLPSAVKLLGNGTRG